MNNQSLDKVRAMICTLWGKNFDEMLSSERKAVDQAAGKIEAIINPELQNLRQELASKLTFNGNCNHCHANELNVLAIIKEKK